MTQDEIQAIFRSVWKPGYGSVAVDELVFIQDLIVEHRPKRFLEIGMASGLSSGFIARFMAENGGEHLVSIDYDDTFFGDPSKPNGFLVPELYPEGPVQVDLLKFHTSLDLERISGNFDMVFIDANHQHPWPAIDTMAVYPRMQGPKIAIQHDLRLFMKQDVMFGIGPKYLYDQFPESHRILSDANKGNIYALSLDMPKPEFEMRMMDLLKLPWSLRTALSAKVDASARHMIEAHYSQQMLDHYDRCTKEQNFKDRFRAGL